jgi:hypothetical protein
MSIENGDKIGSPAIFEQLTVLWNAAITKLLDCVLVPTEGGAKKIPFDAVMADCLITERAEICHKKMFRFISSTQPQSDLFC